MLTLSDAAPMRRLRCGVMLCTASVGSILLHAALSLGLGNGTIVVYDTTDAETFEHSGAVTRDASVSWYCKESSSSKSHYPVCDKSCASGSAICCSSPARPSDHETGSRCLIGDEYQVDDALCGELPPACIPAGGFVPSWTDGSLTPPEGYVDFRCPIPWKNRHFDQAKQHGARAASFDLGNGLFLPALLRDEKPDEITFAVVVVHGSYRSPGEYFNYISNPVDAANLRDRVAIVAPAFPDRPCHASDWLLDDSATGCSPVWSRNKNSQYVYGGGSDDYENCPTNAITSFEALDSVVDQLHTMYPALQRIIVTGFSAGGQMVMRWAVVSPYGVNGQTRNGVELLLVAGGSSTFAYVDKLRPAPSCNKHHRDSTEHVCDDYGRPTDEQIWNCRTTWDNWPFGLSCLDSDTPNSFCGDVGAYVRKSLETGSIETEIAERFASKDFRLAVGKQDNLTCAKHKCADWGEAELQGSDRVQRAINFMQHLPAALEPIHKNYGGTLAFFDAGHSAPKWFATDTFHDWAFQPRAPPPPPPESSVSWYCKEKETSKSHYPVCDQSCAGGSASAICCTVPARPSEHGGNRCVDGDTFQLDNAMCGDLPPLCIPSIMRNALGIRTDSLDAVVEQLALIAVAVGVCLATASLLASEKRKMRQTESWSGMRGVLAFSIFCVHSGVTHFNAAGPFLVLSGAVNTLGREPAVSYAGYCSYMQRRISRVAPTYWLVQAARMLGEGSTRLVEAIEMVLLSSAWTTNDMSWTWFVSCIAYLYAAYPFIALVLRRCRISTSRRLSLLLVAVCYAAQLAIAYLMFNSEDAAPKDAHKYVRHLGPLLISYYQWPPARAPEFIMGIGIANVGKALAAIKGEEVEKLRLTLSVIGDLSFVALLALAVVPSLLWKTAELPLLLHYAFRMNLFSPMFCLMLLGTGFGKAQCSVVARFCTTWLGLALGELSYGFYLWHYMFLKWDYFLDVETEDGGGPKDCKVSAHPLTGGWGDDVPCSPWDLAVRGAASARCHSATLLPVRVAAPKLSY